MQESRASRRTRKPSGFKKDHTTLLYVQIAQQGQQIKVSGTHVPDGTGKKQEFTFQDKLMPAFTDG